MNLSPYRYTVEFYLGPKLAIAVGCQTEEEIRRETEGARRYGCKRMTVYDRDTNQKSEQQLNEAIP
jgi:hypothetical protein